MIDNLQVIGALLGLIAAVILFAINLKIVNRALSLTEVFVIILSSVGLISGLELGYLSLLMEDNLMGELAAHRIPIFLGGIAISWVSVESAIKIFPWRSREDTTNNT